MKSSEVKIVVNGLSENVCLPCTIGEVLENSGLKATQVVVEYNGSVVPRTQLMQISLKVEKSYVPHLHTLHILMRISYFIT